MKKHQIKGLLMLVAGSVVAFASLFVLTRSNDGGSGIQPDPIISERTVDRDDHTVPAQPIVDDPDRQQAGEFTIDFQVRCQETNAPMSQVHVVLLASEYGGAVERVGEGDSNASGRGTISVPASAYSDMQLLAGSVRVPVEVGELNRSRPVQRTITVSCETPRVAREVAVTVKFEDGTPAAGVSLSLMLGINAASPLQVQTTDARGQAAFSLSVEADESLLVRCDSNTQVERLDPDAFPPRGPARIAFELRRPKMEATVVVQAVERGTGPLRGRSVTVTEKGKTQAVATGRTGSDGKATIKFEGLVNTTYVVGVEGFSSGREVALQAGTKSYEVPPFQNIPEVTSSYQLSVYFRDQFNRDRVIPGAVVSANSGSQDLGDRRVNAQGQATLQISLPIESKLQFSAARSDYLPRDPFTVRHGRQNQSGSLYMHYRPDTTEVTFTIVDADSGDRITSGGGQLEGNPDVFRVRRTTERIHISGLHRAQTHKFVFRDGNARVEHEFCPRRDNRNDYTLRLNRSGRFNLTVHRADQTGIKVQGADIFLWDGQRRTPLGQTDSQGRLTIDRLRYGTHQFKIVPRDGIHAGVTTPGVAFTRDNMSKSYGVPTGNPREECERCQEAIARATASSSPDWTDLENDIEEALIWCDMELVRYEEPVVKLELWIGMLAEINVAYSKTDPGATQRRFQEALRSAMDYMDVSDLPNHMRTEYYCYRAWARSTMYRKTKQTSLLDAVIEDLYEAEKYFGSMSTARKGQSYCMLGWLKYLRGEALFNLWFEARASGVADAGRCNESHYSLKEFETLCREHRQCGFSADWLSEARSMMLQMEADGCAD